MLFCLSEFPNYAWRTRLSRLHLFFCHVSNVDVSAVLPTLFGHNVHLPWCHYTVRQWTVRQWTGLNWIRGCNSRATKTSSSAESKGYSPDQSSGFSTTFTTPGSSPEKTPPATRDDTGCFFMPRPPPPCGIQTLMPPPKWLQKRPSNTRSPGLPFPTPPDSAPPHRNVSCQRSTPMMVTLRGGRMTSSDSDRSDFSQQKHKDWITDDILEMIMVRDRLYKRMKKHPAPDIVGMYKKVSSIRLSSLSRSI